MATTETKPIPKEAIGVLDGLLARTYLIQKLEEISEFAELHKRAGGLAEIVLNHLRPQLASYFASMSPEGRGALGLSGSPAAGLYDESARQEARGALELIWSVQRLASGKLSELGKSYDYVAELQAILEPLGVPKLEDTLMVYDMERWGMQRLLVDSGPVAGPYRDLLETEVMRHLTDLGPAELARESRREIEKRIKRKASPLARHLGRYNLSNRIEFWILNVVFGATYEQISVVLQAHEERVANGASPYQWVRTQIRDAHHILGAKRSGRPAKGGVLAKWKLMLK